MNKLKIGVRMGIGYAIVLVLLAAVAWLGIDRMGQMHAHLEQIATVDNTVSTLARDMRTTVDDRMIALRNLALMETPDEKQSELQRIRRQELASADAADKIGKLLASQPELGTTISQPGPSLPRPSTSRSRTGRRRPPTS
jgi:methyl-accepting chemotaxis protein